MILEVVGVGDGEHLLLIDEIIVVNKNKDFRENSTSKWRYTIEITFKSGRHSIYFQDNKSLQNEAYKKIKDALKMFYEKDSANDIIKKH